MSKKFFPRARRAEGNNGRVDWQAKWIWCEGEPSPRNFYLHARRIIELKTAPDAAVIRCTADSRYELYVNGQYVGRGPVRSDPRYQSYDTYDVGSLLTKGKNSIAFLVHHYGDATYSYIPGRGGFICQAEIEQEGSITVVGTDETWRVYPSGPWVSDGAKMSRRLGYQEVYDARGDLGTWTAVKYNDRNWTAPKVLGSPPVPPWENLIPRVIPHLREERVQPSEILAEAAIPPNPDDLTPKDVPSLMASEEFIPLKKGDITGDTDFSSPNGHGIKLKGARSGGKAVIIDFGREVSGRVCVDLTGYAGGVVDIGYSEKLENDRINPSRSEVLYSDRLIMRAGRFVWTTFESRGFRYMQIDFRNIKRPVHLHNVSVVEALYPADMKGQFECSDDKLNRIWTVGAQTARLCMEDSFIDCPWRERGEWWADARIQSHVAYYAFGDTTLLAQGLRHIARTQRRDGAVMGMYPVPDSKIVPDFAALWIMSVWEHYAFTGDRGLLFDLYPVVTRLLHWFNNFTDSDGLLANVEGWNFIDWTDIKTEGEVTAINCLYYKALRRAEHMALVLSRGADADRWNGMASVLRIALNKHLWSPANGLYADSRLNGKLQDSYSRQTNILAVLFDLPDHYRKSTICRQMLNGSLPQITTPYFMGYLTDALFRMGYADEALDLIKRRWGAMIDEGATTFWEHFTPSDSLCHGWSTSPTRDLSGYVLGVQPVSGKRRVRIEPNTGGLEWARGTVPTPFGDVSVDWRQNRRDFVLSIRIPQGMTCVLDLPMAKSGARVVINGKEREGSSFELGSGVYNIKVRGQVESRKTKSTIMDRNAKENVVEYLSAHQLWRSQERRLKRRVRGGVADAEIEDEILTDDEIEYVEGLDEIHPSILATKATEPDEEATERKKPSRSRRRRKTKAEAESGEEQPEMVEARAVEAAAGVEMAESEEAAIEAAVEVEPAGKRRTRRGRRGRGRARTPAETPVEQPVEVTGQAPANVEAVASDVVEAVPVTEEAISVEAAPAVEPGRSRRPRRRPRRRTQASTEHVETAVSTEPAAETPEPEAVPQQTEPVSSVETSRPAPEGRRPRRRSRRKSSEPQPAAVEVAVETPPVEAAVVSEQVADVVSEPVSEKKPSKPRRRSRTRKATEQPDAEAVTAVENEVPGTSVEVPEAAPEGVEVLSDEEPAPAGTVRRRKPYRRKRSTRPFEND